jgi:hypothetical protein
MMPEGQPQELINRYLAINAETDVDAVRKAIQAISRDPALGANSKARLLGQIGMIIKRHRLPIGRSYYQFMQQYMEAVELDRGRVPGYPQDPATVKHRLDTAKAILGDPRSDADSRREAATIVAKSDKPGVNETVENVRAGMAQIYRKLAPKIERHRDSFLAGQLYDELENYAELHGAEREFKQMMNSARNRAHMEYDTNPGGFHNWFWFLPFEDEQLQEGFFSNLFKNKQPPLKPIIGKEEFEKKANTWKKAMVNSYKKIPELIQLNQWTQVKSTATKIKNGLKKGISEGYITFETIEKAESAMKRVNSALNVKIFDEIKVDTNTQDFLGGGTGALLGLAVAGPIGAAIGGALGSSRRANKQTAQQTRISNALAQAQYKTTSNRQNNKEAVIQRIIKFEPSFIKIISQPIKTLPTNSSTNDTSGRVEPNSDQEVAEGKIKDIDIMRQDLDSMSDLQFLRAHGMNKGQFKYKYRDLLKPAPQQDVPVQESLRPGEYHIHTVYFKDGTKKRIRVTSDEFDVADYYTKRGQAVDRVDYDYQIHSDMTEQDQQPGTAIPRKSIIQGYTVYWNPTTQMVSVTRGGDSEQAAIEQARVRNINKDRFLAAAYRMIDRIEELAENITREPKTARERDDMIDKIQRMMTQDRNPANLQIMKKDIEILKAKYRDLKEDSDSTEAVEMAIMRRMLVAHTDLIMRHGLDGVVAAIEEVAYDVGEVDEIGTSDVSAYVRQVERILEPDNEV